VRGRFTSYRDRIVGTFEPGRAACGSIGFLGKDWATAECENCLQQRRSSAMCMRGPTAHQALCAAEQGVRRTIPSSNSTMDDAMLTRKTPASDSEAHIRCDDVLLLPLLARRLHRPRLRSVLPAPQPLDRFRR
jgi:hypothetical protein